MAKFVSLNVRVTRKDDKNDTETTSFEELLVNSDVISTLMPVKDSTCTVVKLLSGDLLICSDEFSDVKKRLK